MPRTDWEKFRARLRERGVPEEQVEAWVTYLQRVEEEIQEKYLSVDRG